MVFFLVLIWGIKLIVPSSLTFAQKTLDPVDLMNRVNAERNQRQIPTLNTNQKLNIAAQGKTDDMLSRSYFSHINPDGNYVWGLIEAAGYKPYTMLGENLAMDFSSAGDLIDAWLASPTHRANLLNPQFQDQGLATSEGQYEPHHDSILVANLFGKLETVKSSGTAATPTPTPTSPKPPTNSTSSGTALAIGQDPKVSVTHVSGHALVTVNISTSSDATLVTAKLKTQSITLLKQPDGRYEGTFTFNLSDNLNGEAIGVEARNASNAKTTSSIPLSNIETLPDGTGAEQTTSGAVGLPLIPVNGQAQTVNILRIIFGILSVIYLGFLVTDWIIIHRAKVDRPGMHLPMQIVIFLLVAIVNIYTKF
jgi:hypothetical protein